MKNISVFFVIFLIFGAFVSAQQNSSAPTVTQISVEARNNLIRLTWTDSPDARGPVYIFRSARPFLGSVPANIRPIAVGYGQQFYIDDTDDMTNLYYFIAASDVSGRRFDVIVPQTNSTFVNLSDPDFPLDLTPTVTAAIDQAHSSHLTANRDGERIIITYDDSEPQKRAILYRSTNPIRHPQDLLNAIVVQSGITFPFIDYPVPGFMWYYALVYEEEISSGNMGISPGINATVTPVSISGEQAAQSFMRPMPLPLLTLSDSHSEGFFLTELPYQAFLNHDFAITRESQRRNREPLQLKRPRVFVIDLSSPAGGEDSALFQIVQEYFKKFEWEGSRAGLQHYLSLPRSREVEARARFYLGQSLYFTGKYREALFEFLTFRSFYPAEANVWLEAVLAAMVH